MTDNLPINGEHRVSPSCLPRRCQCRVLSRLFRRLFLAALADAQAAGRLMFFGEIEGLRRREAFDAHLAPLKRKNWFVYAKPPFAGPEA
jgi:hypothetical protein